MAKSKKSEFVREDFLGIYQEIFDVVGAEATEKIWKCLRGQVISFPIKLYSIDYIMKEIFVDLGNGKSINQIAMEKGYTVKYLSSLITKYRREKNGSPEENEDNDK